MPGKPKVLALMVMSDALKGLFAGAITVLNFIFISSHIGDSRSCC